LRILVTGSAGFIGFHLARRLLADGHAVLGIDGLTPYYDVELKRHRHAILQGHDNFTCATVMLEDAAALSAAVQPFKPQIIVHLAAQAGVRYSLENPRAYVDSNLVGTFNVMEVARTEAPAHFLLASTSSVYGANTDTPFAETDRADHPLTLYAATKKAGEEMSHAYSHLWSIPTTVFRFFTVYGPWGRPDMALFKFAEAMLDDKPIEVFNEGRLERDFTYIGDLVEAVTRLIHTPPILGRPVGPNDSLSPAAPWRTVNIGRGQPVNLMDFLGILERALGRNAEVVFSDMQAGDMASTFARADLLAELTGYRPETAPETAIVAFCDWLRAYRSDPDAACLEARALPV
jgi:UDP-glucuronate 4-epimerase